MSRSTAKGPIKNKGPTYRSGEIDCLLELTQEKIPISGEDWEDIARQHNLRYPEKERSGESLKRKFFSLAKTKARTGDPTIPPEIAKAKKIMQDIVEETDGSTGSAHPYAEFDFSERDELDSRRNDDDGEKLLEPSEIMLEFSRLKEGAMEGVTEGATANTDSGTALADNDDDSKISGKESAEYDDVRMGTVSSRLSSTSNSSEKLHNTKEASNKKRKQYVELSPLSMQFHAKRHARKNATKQLSDDLTLKEMCQMMMLQSSQEIALRREEMKNEMEMRRQEMAMHRDLLASQQQMMNMVMMNIMQQSSKKPKTQNKHSNDSDSE